MIIIILFLGDAQYTHVMRNAQPAPKGGCAIRMRNTQRATYPKGWMRNTHAQYATRNLPHKGGCAIRMRNTQRTTYPKRVDAQYACAIRNAQPAPKCWMHNTQYTYAMHRNVQNPL